MATSAGIPPLAPSPSPVPHRGEKFVSRDPATGAATLNMAFLGALDALAENALTMRREWLTKLSDQRRNVDDECGYPKGPVPLDELVKMYDEEPVAARVVECMPKESWQVSPTVYEDEDEANVTAFEQAWDDLGKQLAANGGQSWHQDESGSPVWDYLQRADILSRIGSFGLLFMGFDDGLDLSMPVPGSVELPPGVEPPEAPQDADKPDALKGPRPRSRKPARRDSTVTNEELTELRKLPKLTRREEVVINFLALQAQAQEAVNNRVAEPRTLVDGTWYNQLGAEAQYFGVQVGPSEPPATKPSGKGLKLLFLRCFSEDLCQVVRYEWDVTNPRFGQPVMYRVTFNDPRTHATGVGLPLATMFVHWSRVIHLADVGHHARSSEIFAAPAMQPVYTRLLDLRKTTGAAGEGYFRGGTPGLILETPPQLGGEVIVDDAKLKDQAELFQNGFQKILRLTALTAKIVAPTVADPTPFCAAFIEQICIKLQIPVRVFKGAERGELASSQDDSSWNDRVDHRRKFYNTPRIIVPFVDRLILVGVLPEPDFVPEPKEVPADALDLPPSAAELEEGKAAGGDAPPGGGGGGKPPSKPTAVKGPPKKVVPGAVPRKTPMPTGNAAPPKPTPKMDRPANDKAGPPSPPSPQDTGAKEEGEASEIVRPVGYRVHWPDLDSNTEKDKADIAKVRVEAIAAYVSGGVDAMIPPLDFLTKVMQFDVLEAKEMLAAADAAAKQAQEEAAALAEEHGLVPDVEGFHDPDAPPPDMLPGMGHPDDADPDMAANAARAAGRLAWLESLVESEREYQANQFCPTGKGGGVDPTCGAGGGAAGEDAPKGPDGKPATVKYPPGFKPPQPNAFREKDRNMPNPDLPNGTRPELSKDQARAVLAYSGTSLCPRINGALREGRPLDKSSQAVVAEMDAAFKRAPVLKEPVQVNRAITVSNAQAQQLRQVAESAMASGGEFKMPGMLSTASGGGTYSGNVKFSIAAVHGLDAKPYSQFPGEKEMILPRDARFRVKSTKVVNGELHIELEQLPPKAPHDPAAESGRKVGLFEKVTGRF